MADSVFATKVSADQGDNSATNPIFTQPTNGTTVGINPGTGATDLGKAEDAVHVSGDTGVMMLVLRQDTQSNLAADLDYTVPTVNASGELRVTTGASSNAIQVDDTAFTVEVDNIQVIGYLADETAPDSVDEGDVGVARMTLDRKQLFVGVDSTTDSQRWTIDANGDLQVTLDDEIVLISRTTAANSETNPIFVQPVTTAVSGGEIHDFNTFVDLGSVTSNNHDYTVANTTFFLKSVIFAASGSIRAEIQTGPIAGLVTKAVGFTSGEEGGTQQLFFDPPIEVPATGTGTVRVIRRNGEDDDQDVYSTIIGKDI